MMDSSSDNPIIAYTDGACRGNPGVGGWGVFIQLKDGSSQDLFGSEEHTTNNRMELMASIQALKYSINHKNYSLTIYTDSQYVKNGITVWIHNWKKNNWKTAAKKEVKNKDLWVSLDELTTSIDTDWRWVKGHSGDEGNDRADSLANKAIDERL